VIVPVPADGAAEIVTGTLYVRDVGTDVNAIVLESAVIEKLAAT
jgi:hypothetical protein